jgi:hypothetical protein
MSTTVACVLRAGKGFTPEYVVKLWEQVRRHWEGPLRFLCLTDTPIRHPRVKELRLEHDWPGYWSKLELFRPDIRGPLLTFDLDTMIVGSLAKIQETHRHTMLRAFKKEWKHRVASGMMFLPEEVRPVIWNRWMLDPKKWMRVHKWPNSKGHLPGDQGFMQETWERSGWGGKRTPDSHWQRHGIQRWQKVCPREIVSYKRHVRKKRRVPNGATVVCFHGKPRPHEIKWRLPA